MPPLQSRENLHLLEMVTITALSSVRYNEARMDGSEKHFFFNAIFWGEGERETNFGLAQRLEDV